MSKDKRKKNEMPKIYAFIDSQNLNLGVQEQGWRLDFKRFRKYLADKYHVVKAFLFIGYVAENESLYTSLQEYGYIVIFKPTLKDRKGRIKGNVDAELILHTMVEYQNYDKAVIVAGDGDYHCLTEYLVKKKKLLRLIVPNRHKYSWLLRKFSQHIDSMNNLRGKLAIKGK